MNYKQQAIVELAADISSEGLQVFIASNGEYGIFTDKLGDRLVSFQFNLGEISFYTNHVSNAPDDGSGSRIPNPENFNTYASMFNVLRIGGIKYSGTLRHKTLQEYLDSYQTSSKYTQVK